MVVVALLSVDLVESVDLVTVDLVVNCITLNRSIAVFVTGLFLNIPGLHLDFRLCLNMHSEWAIYNLH